MIHLKSIYLVAILLLVVVCQANSAVKKINYKGWEQSIELGNKPLRMVVVPSIGKIMSFSSENGKNLIWNNDKIAGLSLTEASHLEPIFGWANYGGDRFWVVQQHDIAQLAQGKRWPPDPVLEGKPWKVRIGQTGTLQLESKNSNTTGIKAQRIFEMVADTPMVCIKQTITAINTQRIRPLNLIQNVATINKPDAIIFKIPNASHFRYNPLENSTYPKGISRKTKPGKSDELSKIMKIKEDYAFVFQSKEGASGKLYTDIRSGWICSLYSNQAFFLLFKYYPNHYYPDGGCTMEIYVSNSYCEIELLSPATVLRHHEKIRFDIYYAITQLQTNDALSVETALRCEKVAEDLLTKCTFPPEVFLKAN